MFNKKQKEVAEQTTKSEKGIHSFDEAIGAISPSTLSAVAGVTALIGTVKSLSGAFSTAIANYSHFEKMQMGLETFFQDADKGKAKFEELRKLSNETTYGVDELTDAFTQMANVGVNVDTIKDKLIMLGNVASGDKAKFAELVSIYSKIQSTGKVGAMQLQQIATRGIPIYDMLKKMGVQGNATAEDITKAFQNMTSEIDETTGSAGQFYNAMENINKTIEGKEGFISDYFKELTVNFAEVSGIADTYKAVLDVLREHIGNISDKLLEWNSNPIIKAIIQGTLVAMISSLVVVIGVSLVSALHAVAVQLGIIAGLKAVISPVGAIAGVTALVAGLSIGVASYKKNVSDAEEETRKLAKAVEDAKKAMGNNYYLQSVGVNPNSTANKNRENASSTLDLYKQNLTGFTEELEKAKNKVASLEDKIKSDGGGLTGYEGRLQSAKAEVEKWQNAINLTNKSIAEQTRLLKFYEEEVKRLDVSTLANDFDKIYEGTISKKQKELDSIQSQLTTVLAYEEKLKKLNGQKDSNGSIIDYNKSKDVIDKTVEYLQNQLNKTEIQLKVTQQTDWQKKLQSAFGFTDLEVYNGATSSTVGALEQFQKMWTKMGDMYKQYGIKDSKYEDKQAYAKALRSAFEAVLESVREGTYTGSEESLKSFAQAVKDFTDKELGNFFSKLNDEVNKIIEKASNGEKLTASEYGKYAGQTALSSASGVGGDAGTFINTFMQTGNVFLALISTIIGALVNVLQEVDGFEETLSPITKLFKQLKPALGMIVEEVQYAEDTMETVLLPIMGLLNGIITILKPLSELLNKFIRIQFTAFGLFDLLGEKFREMELLTDDVNKEKEDELALMRKMKDAYDKLYDATKEQEEYYLKTKTELLANSYKENTVRKVNDMILTDKGVFSTSPQDTIMAMKHPESLLGGKTEVNVQVIDNVGVNGNIRQEGNNILIELISQKIAGDYADGSNGWDVAVQAQQQSSFGRSFSL